MKDKKGCEVMTITNANDIISTIPDPYKLESHLKKYNVSNTSKGIFFSLVLDFYEMLADPNIKISADFSQGLLTVFRQAAKAMLSATTNYDMMLFYGCHPKSVHRVRREVNKLIESCDIYAI